jgi:hypothetical protein
LIPDLSGSTFHQRAGPPRKGRRPRAKAAKLPKAAKFWWMAAFA